MPTVTLSESNSITIPSDILKKLALVGYDLETYSLDTVKMFYNDAVAAGFRL